MVQFCHVPKCLTISSNSTSTTTTADGAGITFFSFTKSEKRITEWLKCLGIEDWSKLPLSTLCHYKICSKHFEEKFIFISIGGKPKLTFNAVPLKWDCPRKAVDEVQPKPKQYNNISSKRSKNDENCILKDLKTKDCTNCQRLANDLASLTIAFKKLKKWVNNKLEIEIPPFLDYLGVAKIGLVDDPVPVQVKVEEDHERILKNHNLIAECLENNTEVRLERLSLSTTAQNQGSSSNTDNYDYDIVNNSQRSESRSEASIKSEIQNNSDEDGPVLLPIIITADQNRIRPISRLKSNKVKKRKVSNQFKKEENYIKPSQKIKKPPVKRKQSGFKIVLCPKCGKLISQSYLSNHIKVVHDHGVEKELKECPHCHKKYSKLVLKQHIRYIHAADLKSLQRICPFCATTFKNEKGLRTHLTIFHNEDRTKFKCSFPQCNREFYWEYLLKTHAKSHSQDLNVAKPFKCTVEKCDKRFASKIYLNSHIETFHKGQEQGSIVCEYLIDTNRIRVKCSERFLSYSELKRHKYLVHNQQYEFKCTFDGCFQSYLRESFLITHLQSHEKTKNYKKKVVGMDIFKECPICLKQINVTRNSSYFNIHIKYVHEGKRPTYPCSFENCEKSFQTQLILGVHVKRHHPDHFKQEDYPALNEYSCSECNKIFYSNSKLIQHKSAHLKVGTFGCNFCDAKFKRKTFVKYHTQSVHSSLKPFTCNYENCGKTFALKYYLTSHISQVHLGKTRIRPKLKK